MAGIYPIDTVKFKECLENMSSDESNVSQTQLSSFSNTTKTVAEQSYSELINNQSQNAISVL